MSKKPVLSDVVNIQTSAPTINANSDAIQEAFENTLSRDGSTPNEMEADLDMNSNDILNVKSIDVSDTITLGGVDIQEKFDQASADAQSAKNSASAAEGFAEASEASAVNAANSAVNAALYDPTSRFLTIANMAASVGAENESYASVVNAFNGEEEVFQFLSPSSLPADGTLVVGGVGGQWVSKRTAYADFAEMDADPRELSAGTRLSVSGVEAYEVVLSGEQMTTSGGIKLKTLFEVPVGSVNILAHRGFRNVNTQNTMVAFSEALKWTPHLECDVQSSADDTRYVFHDTTVDVLTNGTGTFTTLSDATIDGLAFDTLGASDLYSLVRVPKFPDFLSYASRNNATVWPEIKNPRNAADVDAVCQDVLDAEMQLRCVIQASWIVYAEQVLDYHPELSCGYLNGDTNISNVRGFVDRLANYPNRGWLVTLYDVVTANPSLVEYCRARRVGLACWTIPNQNVANQLVSLGVEYIMTDLPLSAGEH